MIIKQVPRTIELTTFERAYNMVQQSEEEVIEIPLYINYADSYLVKKDNITNAVIKNDDASLAFAISKIEQEDEVYLKSKKFYKYIFTLTPNITLEDDFKLEILNSILELSYVQGVKVSVNIGSFSYYFYNNDDTALSIKQLKGLVNTYEDKTLVGITLGLKNNTNDNIKLKNIIALDANVNAELGEIKLNKEFNQGDSIDEILGYIYNPYSSSKGETIEIEIENDNDINIFIPLKYKQNILLNKLGFLIEYEMNNQVKYLCIDDFMFFETSLYSINKINNLKFHIYENY